MALFDTTQAAEVMKQQQLAQALRGRQQRLAEREQQGNTITTGGNATHPGFTNVNWGGILSNAVGDYKERKLGEQATAAEADADSARNQALGDLTADGFESITPAQALQLQELGVDIGDLKSYQPKKEPLANLFQNMDNFTVADAPMLARQYNVSEEEMATLIQSSKANRKALSDEEYKRELALKQIGLKSGGGSTYETELAKKQAAADVKVLGASGKLDQGIARADELIAETEAAIEAGGDGFFSGDTLRTADAAANLIGLNDKFAPSAFNDRVKVLKQKASQFHLDAMTQMQGYGQVTEKEQKIISDTQFDEYDPPEVRLEKLKTIQNALKEGQKKVDSARERVRTGSTTNLGGNTPSKVETSDDGWTIEEG